MAIIGPRPLLFYERDVNESKCLKISRGGGDVRVMVFNATLKKLPYFNINRN